jgi:hypothetical protein
MIRNDLSLSSVQNLQGFEHFKKKADEFVAFVEGLSKPSKVTNVFGQSVGADKTPSQVTKASEPTSSMHERLSDKLEDAKGYLKDANRSGLGFDVVRRTLEPTLSDSYFQEKPGFARYKALAEQILAEAAASEAIFAPVLQALGKAAGFTVDDTVTNLQALVSDLKSSRQKFPKDHTISKEIEEKITLLEKELADRVKSQQARTVIETTFAKYKNEKTSTVNIKDVIVNPEKYKNKVIRSRVQLTNGPFPIFCPIATLDSGIGFACPKEMFDKIKKVHSASGDYGIVNIKYWCNGSGNTADFGVLLDVER